MPIGFTRLQAFGYRSSLKQAEANNPPNLQLTHSDSDEISFSGKPAQQDLSPRRLFEPRRLLSRLWQAILAPIRWPLAKFGLLPQSKERSAPVATLAAFRDRLAAKNPFASRAGTPAQAGEANGSSSGTDRIEASPGESGQIAAEPFEPESVEGMGAHPGDSHIPAAEPRFGSAGNPFAAAPIERPVAGAVQEIPQETLPKEVQKQTLKATKIRQHFEERRLWDAVHAGETKAVRRLIAAGADVNIRLANGKTPLHLAVAGGNLPLVLALLEAPNIRLNAADGRGTHPLHIAVRENHPAIVDVLAHHGAELEADSWYENRPLHLAAELGHEEAARRLLQYAAEVNGQSWQGYTPLYWAARRGHLGLVQTLLAQGADATIPNRDEETSLHGAVRGGNPAVMEALLNALSNAKSGAKGTVSDRLNLPNKNGETLLHLAARKDHLAVLDVLTAHGGDLHRASHSGETPQSILDKRRPIRAHRESGPVTDS